MSQQRAEQIAEVIQRKMNDFFIREVEFPQDVMVTITEVEVTPDLKHALMLLSVLPITKTGTILKMVNSRLKHARHFLSAQMTMRQCPELKVTIDNSALKHRKIEKILEDINKESGENT